RCPRRLRRRFTKWCSGGARQRRGWRYRSSCCWSCSPSCSGCRSCRSAPRRDGADDSMTAVHTLATSAARRALLVVGVVLLVPAIPSEASAVTLLQLRVELGGGVARDGPGEEPVRLAPQ